MKTVLECSHIINIYQKEDNPPKDRGNLYLSSVYLLGNSTVLKENNINCLFSIIDESNYLIFQIQEKMKLLNIKEHKWVDVLDSVGAGIYDHLNEAHAYIKQMLLGHNVLVHCQMGKCRSPSLVAAFLIKEYGMTYDQAGTYIRSKRDIISINKWFESDLRKFEQEEKNSHSSKDKE